MKHLSSNQELIDWCKKIVVCDRAKNYTFKDTINGKFI
jgi:hypothetical protein